MHVKDENVWPLIILLPSNFSFVLLVEKILYYIFDIHGEVNFFLQHIQESNFNFLSNHPLSQKRSVASSLYHRAGVLCSENSIHHE